MIEQLKPSLSSYMQFEVILKRVNRQGAFQRNQITNILLHPHNFPSSKPSASDRPAIQYILLNTHGISRDLKEKTHTVLVLQSTILLSSLNPQTLQTLQFHRASLHTPYKTNSNQSALNKPTIQDISMLTHKTLKKHENGVIYTARFSHNNSAHLYLLLNPFNALIPLNWSANLLQDKTKLK